MNPSNFWTRLYTSLIVLALIVFFVYLFYNDEKIEHELDMLIDVQHRINQNFDICYSIYQDILNIWDDNYYQSQFDINSKIEEYLKIKSIDSKINEARKRNQQLINKKFDEIRNINFKDNSVYRKLLDMNSLSKQYCLSVLSFNRNNRDSYPETVLPIENEYFDIYSSVSNIIDYY